MGQIKGLFADEMPREKLKNTGPESLTTLELLAILLRTGTKDKNVLQLSREILNEFEISDLSTKSYEELILFSGISEAKASQLIALFELSRRLNVKSPTSVHFKNSREIFEFVKNKFLHLRTEKIIVLYLNSKNFLLKEISIIHGNTSSALFDSHRILKGALLSNAEGFILIHNHPSGNPTPSKDDVRITLKLEEMAKTMNLRFQDHLIIGNDDYYSFHDNEGL